MSNREEFARKRSTTGLSQSFAAGSGVSRFWVWGLGSVCGVWGSKFGVRCSVFGVRCLGVGVLESGFGV